ncbi:MAG: hypothetical protein RLZZ46_1663, partial [Bacteroidota bacterium]
MKLLVYRQEIEKPIFSRCKVTIFASMMRLMFFLLLLPPIFFKSLGANPGRPFPPHRIDRAYEALKIFNYFKAREIFLRPTKKWPVLYAHGLAVIY